MIQKLLILGLALSLIAPPAKILAAEVGGVKVSLQTLSGWDGDGSFLTASHLRGTVGNHNLDASGLRFFMTDAQNLLDKSLPGLGEQSSGSIGGGGRWLDAWAYSVNVELSSVAYLSKNHAHSTLMESADERLAATRAQMISDTRAAVSKAVYSNPKLALASKATKEAMIESTVQGVVKSKIDPGLAAKRAAINSTFDDRTSQAQAEASFQELSVVLQNTNWPVILKVGKFTPQMGSQLSLGGQKIEEDSLRLVNRADLRTFTTMPGGTIQGDWFVDTEKGRFTISAWLFHDRPFWVDSTQYVGTLATLPDSTYEESRKFLKLNSQALRLLFEGKDFSVFVSYGKFRLGREEVRASEAKLIGATYFVTPNDIITVSMYQGDRYQLKEAQSAYLTHNFSDWARATMGLVRMKGYRNPQNSSQEHGADYTEHYLNLTARLVNEKNFLKVCDSFQLVMGVDYYQRNPENEADLVKSAKEGYQALLGLNCN